MNGQIIGLVICASIASVVAGCILIRQPMRVASVPEKASAPPGDRVPKEKMKARLLRSAALRVGPLAIRFIRRSRQDRIEGLLEAAGHPAGVTLVRYVGLQAVLAIIFGVAGATHVLGGRPVVGAAMAACGWFAMDLWVRQAARNRQATLDRELPGLLDVLAVTVTAGVPPPRALEAVAATMGGALGAEVSRALSDVAVGGSLQHALEDLRKRNPAPSLGRAVTAMINTLELGAVLSPVLTELSADVRQQQREEVLARAARAAPRISLVVAITFVPACLAVVATALLVGPAISLLEVFGR